MTDPLNSDGLAALRDRLWVAMLGQPSTEARDTYSDGFKNGLIYSIEHIDKLLAATPASTGEPVAWTGDAIPINCPFPSAGTLGAPDAYEIDPGIGSAMNRVQREWPAPSVIENMQLRGGSVRPLYLAPPEVSALQAQIKALTEERDASLRLLKLSRKATSLRDAEFRALSAEARATEAERQLAEDAWQDISTAPKDGTRFLVWYEEFGGQVEIGQWGTGSIAGRFYVDSQDDNVHEYPRFWRRLPAPPVLASTKEKADG